MTTPFVGIVGPTGSGKTDLALALARRRPVEIVVADSRQVYRGMDIGTAKPDAAARASVPHHLLDLVDPDEPFSVAQWVERARRVVPQITARGRLPLIVGGTGLYVTALVDGHDYAAQPWAPEVRARLDEELSADGLEALARRLAALDPDTASQIDLRNPRRVLRALERAAAGDGGSALRARPWPGAIVLLALDRPRGALYARIDARTRALFASGLLDEARALLDRGYRPPLRPMTGHGYAEAMRVLAGEWDLEVAIEVTARRTRQYAKRQLTWFRRDPRVQWLAAGDLPADAPELVDAAASLIRAGVGETAHRVP